MKLNPSDRLVLSALHGFADQNGCAAESTRTLGEFVGRSAPTVAASLHRLTANGCIQRLGKTSRYSVGRYRIPTKFPVDNFVDKDCKSLLNMHPTPGMGNALPDVFRSSALRTAGVLHRAAPKEQEMAVNELLGLGVVRTVRTLRKSLDRLSSLPIPLATEHADPWHMTRRLWVIHALTDEAETINLDYLNQIPGAEPKTRAMHARENASAQRQYLDWFGGHPDPAVAYAADVEPFVVSDPDKLGCQVWTGEVNADGYSQPYAARPFLSGHRLAWLAVTGYLKPGDALHHSCGNRRCVYVGHLAPVSPEQHHAIHANDRMQ